MLKFFIFLLLSISCLLAHENNNSIIEFGENNYFAYSKYSVQNGKRDQGEVKFQFSAIYSIFKNLKLFFN